MLKPLSIFATLCIFTSLTTSCVPLLIGGLIGYIARDEGVGIVQPINQQNQTHPYNTTPSDSQEYPHDYPIY